MDYFENNMEDILVSPYKSDISYNLKCVMLS